MENKNVRKTGRVRKKSTRYIDFESPDNIDITPESCVSIKSRRIIFQIWLQEGVVVNLCNVQVSQLILIAL